MKKIRLSIVLLFAMLTFISLEKNSYASDHEVMSQNSSLETQETKEGTWENSFPECPDVSCVPNCTTRNYSGECIRYGRDFCGMNPSCVPVCSKRSNTGECIRYDQDFCSENRPFGC